VRAASLLGLLVLVACERKASPGPEPAPEPAPDVPASLDIEDPEACRGCHEDIVAEWTQSMHAAAHASADPIFAALLELRSSREGADRS
jgi:hypothetical protein